MACSSPLYGVREKMLDPETGEIIYGTIEWFAGEKIRHVDNKFRFLRLTDFKNEKERLAEFERLSKKTDRYDTALIPCGRCLECRLEYSRQWANRCMLEASTSTNNWFFTFTYDDDHLPKNSAGYPTLVKEEISKFMKDFRRQMEFHYQVQGIRFFACGEYGSESGRPHYHGIIFNAPLTDLVYLYTRDGHAYFNSPFVDKIWDKGYVVITDVNWDACAYVARYVVKKAKGETSSVYKDLDIVPEYVRMSRRPGIGTDFYEQHKDTIYKYDKVTVPGGVQCRPSHYFDKKFDVDDPVTLCLVKEQRVKVGKANMNLQLKETTLDPIAYQQACHEALVKKIQSLKRDQF